MAPGQTTEAPEPLDLSTEPHLQGLFEPVVDEVDVTDLRIEGELPEEIDGDYIRNGPNPRFAPLGAYLYPLDGDGMLHRVQVRGGRARYTNRFVRTPAVVAEERRGRALWPGLAGFGYAPGSGTVRLAQAHTQRDLPGINVVRHGGRLLALAESANPFLVAPDLETLGRSTFRGGLPAGITAHPKIDPVTGEMVAFCYGMRRPFLTWSVIGKDGTVLRSATPIAGVERPSMVHDMALTPTYVVLVLAPFFFDPAGAMGSGSPMSWEPDRGTHIALIPRAGGPTRWLHTEPFWLWHTANACDVARDGGAPSVVLDYVEWTAPAGLVRGVKSKSALSRLHLDPTSGKVRRETLVDRDMEFPRIDDRSLSHRHRTIGTSLETGPRRLLAGDADTLGWYDTATRAFALWHAGNLSFGEQTFIPRPGDADPRHGWWTTIATDRADRTSRLLVIPAADPASGPIATVHLPRRVPLGLHGAWLPSAP